MILYFNEKYFLSLSWIIDELGKLKDEGLRTVVIKEALQSNNNITDENAFKQTMKILGNKQAQTVELLKKAEKICEIYYKENNLEHLVAGIDKNA